MDNVFVYDVDDLQQVAEENLAVRAREAAQAEQIVEEEVESFLTWRRSLELAPTIVALRKRFGQVADEELQRALDRLQELDDSQRRVVEAMSRSLINKLLHQPMTELKAGAGEPDGAHLIDAARRLFGLVEGEPERDEERSTQPSPESKVTALAPATTGPTSEAK